MNDLIKLKRTNCSKLDDILGVSFNVLDHGFIRLIDYMGTDESIVQAARVSYGKGTKKISDDRGLIRYLMRHRHTTPFEMCEIKLHVKVPMDCWRQWIRHRTANVNEYSTRYSIAIIDKFKTLPDKWRLQKKDNKQGSLGTVDLKLGSYLSKKEEEFQDFAQKIYDERIEQGVAREQARKDLPLSNYTEAFWKIDLHNLLHFLELRLSETAQYEIKEYAKIIGFDIVKKWCPITWEAFEEYRLNSIDLSSFEIEVIKQIFSGNHREIRRICLQRKILLNNYDPNPKSRERIELETKLIKLGINIPW